MFNDRGADRVSFGATRTSSGSLANQVRAGRGRTDVTARDGEHERTIRMSKRMATMPTLRTEHLGCLAGLAGVFLSL